MRNETIKLIQSHRSIRRYIDNGIPQELLTEILISAQWAPSSHNVQAYSMIVIDDYEKKKKLSFIAGSQKYVASCPIFIVFCADFYRLSLTSEMYNTNFEIGEVENILVAAVDTALAAENALLAARSFGLGGVMIGGIRNNPWAVKDLLELPKFTIPLMGLCLGYPDQTPLQKPRTPQEIVVHYNTYQSKKHIEKGLQKYEKVSAEYYKKRTNGNKTVGWTKQMSKYLNHKRRTHLKDFIEDQGFHFK